MSPGVMSSSASASATERLTTRQSLSSWPGPPTPVSTSTAPPGWVTTKPCTGHSRPSTPRRLARCNRLTSSVIGDCLPASRPERIRPHRIIDAPHRGGTGLQGPGAREGVTGLCSNRDMCTAILSIEPGAPALVAGIRDELVDRAWVPPGRHWPDYPGVVGGQDLLPGGTSLALAPEARRVACVLNGRGRMAPAQSRRSRGVLPLQAAVEGKPGRAGLADFDPFHLLSAEPETATLWSWDGERLTERELTAGLHVVVNSGLDSDLVAGDEPGSAGRSAGWENTAGRPAGWENTAGRPAGWENTPGRPAGGGNAAGSPGGWGAVAGGPGRGGAAPRAAGGRGPRTGVQPDH